MTDTPTPAMTPEQRAELVTHYTRGKWYIWNGGADCPVPLGTRLEIAGGFDDTWTTVAEEGSIFWPNVAAFRINPPTSNLTAERDDARDGEKTARNLMQKAFDVNRKVIAERIGLEDALTTAHAEIARLTAALATAREDGMREVKEIKPTQAQIDDACLSYRHDYGLMTPANRALLRFEATEWLLAWGKTVTKGAAT